MEYWDIYDSNRKLTGKVAERGTWLGKNEYHLAVQVWIRNDAGQWLISKRAADKKSEPLKWEPTGGSVMAGEDSLQGALREVREELGITLDQGKGKLMTSFRREFPQWEYAGYVDVWLFTDNTPIEIIVPQREEICDVMWATEQQIFSLIEDGVFVPMKHYPYFNELFPHHSINGTASGL